MSDYIALLGLFTFVFVVGGVGFFALHVQRLKDQEADKARRESLEKH